MAARRIIIDCDPGQDDAVALFLALSSPEELEVLGITTVAGNVPLDLTQRNARMMCDLAGCDDIRVFAGCDRPLLRERITAEYIHGDTGIDGIDVFEPRTPLQPAHAVEFLIETLLAAEAGTVTLVPTGPMTNIGAAIQREPAVLRGVRDIVAMGGAMREGGNRTPSAEFNILADPHAADIVLRCGRPIVLMGLDVTHQVMSTRARVERYDSAKYGAEGAPLHDPCTVAWLLEPGLFETRTCNVAVEKDSELTMGHTAVDFWHVTDRPRNVQWAHAVDADRFYDLLVERLARFGVAE